MLVFGCVCALFLAGVGARVRAARHLPRSGRLCGAQRGERGGVVCGAQRNYAGRSVCVVCLARGALRHCGARARLCVAAERRELGARESRARALHAAAARVLSRRVWLALVGLGRCCVQCVPFARVRSPLRAHRFALRRARRFLYVTLDNHDDNEDYDEPQRAPSSAPANKSYGAVSQRDQVGSSSRASRNALEAPDAAKSLDEALERLQPNKRPNSQSEKRRIAAELVQLAEAEAAGMPSVDDRQRLLAAAQRVLNACTTLEDTLGDAGQCRLCLPSFCYFVLFCFVIFCCCCCDC